MEIADIAGKTRDNKLWRTWYGRVERRVNNEIAEKIRGRSRVEVSRRKSGYVELMGSMVMDSDGMWRAKIWSILTPLVWDKSE